MAIGFVGRALRRAGRERARTNEGWTLQCFGCGRGLGRKGDAPAELLPITVEPRKKLYSHRTESCRGQSLRRYLEDRGLVASP